ncbi:putative helicase MOV-10 [Mercenaria mercenaria]|uniref:putative helicase MOV-10 n=1 Tax=Mercenaria mercenaria TaxID=6596 RepID=UPI00234FA12F|nr:putative helicase MOV-10 [Mercenaria mercenaria]
MSRPTLDAIIDEADLFVDFLDEMEFPDVIKRDDLRELYNTEFTKFRKRNCDNYVKINFGNIAKELKDRKAMHELGDYYSFEGIQSLFEELLVSKEHEKTMQEWQAQSKQNPCFCQFCGVDCQNMKNYKHHKTGARHRIHKFFHEIYTHRDGSSNPSGIEIQSEPPVNDKGFIENTCKPDEETSMTLSVKNTSKNVTQILRRHLLLWDTRVFTLMQKYRRLPVKPNRHIQRGESYDLLVTCRAPLDYGHHFVPMAFYFDAKDRHHNLIKTDEQESVVRYVSVHVIGEQHDELAPTTPYTNPELITEDDNITKFPGEPVPESGKSILAKEYKLTPYRRPKKLKTDFGQGVSPKNYRVKFDHLLWHEEEQMEEDIKRYDMFEVEMGLGHTGLMVLEVPGLLEKRPSVMKGDSVNIYRHKNRSVRYKAFVHKVECSHVHLGVGERLRDMWVSGMKFDISFKFSKVNLWKQHRALSDFGYAENILFPSQEVRRDETVQMKPWFYKHLNPEQQTAVTNIVQGTSRPGPYLIFGPPGTGKTVTVTEAIRQVYYCKRDAKILVCCPENAAADFVMRNLINTNQAGTVNMADIYRLYAVSRDIITVPASIKDSKRLNYDEFEGEFFYPAKVELKRYKILIVTLSTAGRLVSAAFPRNHFTHIFIDEGAHATEPECIVPITGLLDSRSETCGQLIIAGDPKQLGPILRSETALKFGLDQSILERFINNVDGYMKTDSKYNQYYITKFIRNYRSHEAIIHVPRELFYDKELECHGDPMILNCMTGWEHLPNKHFPVIFHSVFGKSEREETSPSFFNRDEISQVEKYLNMLLKEKKGGVRIKPSDIGVISPYRKQVEKLRKMIGKNNYGKKGEITLGPVEEFQGQEFKVIIISTVRTKDDFLKKELQQKELGFLRNPKRFNVAITRAKALLIVIGNPLVLEMDIHWKKFIDYCDSNGGFRGQCGKLSPGRDNSGCSDDISIGKASMRMLTEDPAWVARD